MSSLAATIAAFALWLRPTGKPGSEGAGAPIAIKSAAGAKSAGSAENRQPQKPTVKLAPGEYPDINTLRNAIPPHCFKPSLWISCSYLVRDIILIAATAYAGLNYIPQIEGALLRTAVWMAYGFVQGLFCTGLWILAHECGHGGFSLHQRVNNVIGWAAHSFLMVPYFSWKFSHARHHRFTGNMEKDMAFVPRTFDQYQGRFFASLGVNAEMFEDAPIVSLLRLITHQVFGWQTYLIFNVTSGPDSLQKEGHKGWVQSHFDPMSSLFRPNERVFIAITDLGLLITLAMLYYGATVFGWTTMFFAYTVPYIWVHHWLVAITYLHHTDPDVPHFDAENWSYVKGALATIDRDFGFIGRTLFHGIIETHVVHHLFSKIPFYYAEEATEAIKPILGDLYHHDDGFMDKLWPTFDECKYVEPDTEITGNLRWANTKKDE